METIITIIYFIHAKKCMKFIHGFSALLGDFPKLIHSHVGVCIVHDVGMEKSENIPLF